mmetsp:Transcript_26407/g.69380  ORF Transcript_26407/g.69380 Transcript_26407/m.69380 type:complete len:87 (-) Transcript_26407:7-267(-)
MRAHRCVRPSLPLPLRWSPSLSFIPLPRRSFGCVFFFFDFSGLQLGLWVKIVDSWVLAAAFLWAMLAPLVCSGRDFGGAGQRQSAA